MPMTCFIKSHEQIFAKSPSKMWRIFFLRCEDDEENERMNEMDMNEFLRKVAKNFMVLAVMVVEEVVRGRI